MPPPERPNRLNRPQRGTTTRRRTYSLGEAAERLQYYYRPRLAAYQRAFLDHTARYTVVEAAAKTGKTTACLVWLLERALAARDGHRLWWVAPVYSQAKIGFRRLRRLLSGLEGLRVKESELSLLLPNGAAIDFRSGHRPDDLYGEDVQAAVFDEATRCPPESWHALRSTLTATRGAVKIIGNVKGRRNWVHEMAQRAAAGDGTVAAFRITAYDAVSAGLLSEDEVADAKAALPEHVFRELYLAEPAEAGANPFGLTAIEAAAMPGTSTAPARFFGVDLARSQDWTVVIGLDWTGRVAHFERFRGERWEQITRRILAAVGRAPALVDKTGVGDPIVEQLRHAQPAIEGLHFTAERKQHLMEGLALAIEQQAVRFPEGPVRDELEAFEYEHTRTGVRYCAPSGKHDDCVCALALAVRCLNTQRPRQQFDFFIS